MSPEFAVSLAEIRLLQVARLLEWMRDNVEVDVETLSSALGDVEAARRAIRGLKPEAAATD